MKFNRSIIGFTAAAIVVMMLGALGGWYIFVNQQVETTDAQDRARGFGSSASFGGSLGSAISNLFGRGATDEELGVTDASAGGSGGFSLGGIGNLVSGIVGGIVGPGGENDGDARKAPRMWKIHQAPVAGFGFADNSSKVYFADRASGNILSADPADTKLERLTNTLFPQTYEAIFARDGSVVLRLIGEQGELVSYAAAMATNTSPAAGDTVKKLEGVYLPQNIVSISARTSPNELFFILKEGDGSAGITSNWFGGGQKRIFTSALSDWAALQLQDGTRYVVQKPSDDIMGFGFKISDSGNLEKVANLPGLGILPRTNSSAILYSSVRDGEVTLYARASADGNEIKLPVRTTADKCVWAPDTRLIAYCAVPQTSPARGYLRDLFDGTGHTSDAWWRIDVSANAAEQIFVPDLSISFDAEAPAVDTSGTHIGFIDSKDKSLWLFRIQP